jgi:hypothetical protein
MRRGLLWGVCLIAAVLAPVWPCATATSDGFPVPIAGEQAVIVWDARTQTEHFIRNADFRVGRGADFGFIVPTPSRPTLDESPRRLFDRFADLTAPKPRAWALSFKPLLSLFVHARSAPTAPVAGASGAPVEVLEERKVAGFDAAVLKASDPGALAAWLKAHGYRADGLESWLERYVKDGWTLTAFKVNGASTGPMRLAFQTPRPFYPYREPASARAAGGGMPRQLTVYVVAGQRMQGALGDNGRFPGEVQYAAPSEVGPLLQGAMPSPAIPTGKPWVTKFVDRSSPRPGTDEVFFSPAASQETVIPPPVVTSATRVIWLPPDGIAFLAVVAGLVLGRRRLGDSRGGPRARRTA